MRNWLKTASLCMLAAFALAACGCGGEKEKTSTDRERTSGSYLTKPFNPNVEKLPPNFIGCDASAIYNAATATFLGDDWKRGEYEKSVDYVKRVNNMIAQLGEKTLIGDIKFSSTLAFTLPPVGAVRGSKKDKSVETLYDADGEVLTISAGDSFWFSEKEKYSFGVHLQRGEGGTLAPGGDFWLIPPDDWGIIFTESDNLPTKDIVWRLREVTPEKAQRERNKIGALCVCNLRYDNITQATQGFYKNWAVRVTEPEFWLYHIETGDVLAKYSWNETERGVTKKIGDLTIENDEKTATPVLENRPTKEEVIRVIKGEANETREESSNKSSEAPERKTEESSETLVYATEPFNPGWETLPPNYYGHDPEAIYKAVDALVDESKWKKDEFEKTTDYKKRVDNFWQELQDKTLVGDVNFASTLAFAFTEEARPAVSLTENVALQSAYDADKETLVLSAFAGLEVDHPVSYSKKLCGLCFQTRRAIRETKVGVAFTESSISANLTLTLCDVAPSVARELSGKLGVLCVCQLAWREEDDVLWAKSCYKGAAGKAIWTTEPVFWLYNVETGEVLAKFSLDEVKRGRGKEIGDISVNKLGWDNRTGETADELRARISAEKGEKPEELARKLAEKIERESLKVAEKAKREAERKAREAEREAREAVENLAKERRRSAEFWENGNKRLDNRLAAVKRLTPSREVAAPLQIAVPGDCATLAEALDDAAKKASKDEIPRIVLDAGEYDASGLTLKTFVDIQSASGKPGDVVLTVDAASPITVDGETVVSFDGVTLRQVGGGAKSGACVEVKRGIALFYGCVLDGKNGAKSATGVKAVGLKSAAVLHKCVATGFSLSALHVEDGAFGWAVESVFGPKNRFGASSKAARLEAEKCEFRGNETALYFRGIATGGAQGNVYAENKRDAQILDGAKVEVDAPNVDAGK